LQTLVLIKETLKFEQMTTKTVNALKIYSLSSFKSMRKNISIIKKIYGGFVPAKQETNQTSQKIRLMRKDL
jgi:hypothetical protein